MDIFWISEVLEREIRIEGPEVKHITKSLRKKSGDFIYCTDGKGHLFECRISDFRKSELSAHIINTEHHPPLPYHLHIAISPLKNTSRLENFVEKVVEIGIQDIHPVMTRYSEKSSIRWDRIDRIIEAACKQSKQFHKPRLHELCTFDTYLKKTSSQAQSKYIAYVEEHTSTLSKKYSGEKEVYILIGPEGGFTKEEIKMAKLSGWTPVSLGRSRLRTETAGIVSSQIIKTIYEINQ